MLSRAEGCAESGVDVIAARGKDERHVARLRLERADIETHVADNEIFHREDILAP